MFRSSKERRKRKQKLGTQLSFSLSKTKKRFPDYEQCAFANAALAQLWPYLCLAAAEAARELINPLLEEQRPPWMTKIEITRLQLGPRPPTIEGVKVFPPSSSSSSPTPQTHGGGPSQQSDAVVFEVDVDWAGSQGE